MRDDVSPEKGSFCLWNSDKKEYEGCLDEKFPGCALFTHINAKIKLNLTLTPLFTFKDLRVEIASF